MIQPTSIKRSRIASKRIAWITKPRMFPELILKKAPKKKTNWSGYSSSLVLVWFLFLFWSVVAPGLVPGTSVFFAYWPNVNHWPLRKPFENCVKNKNSEYIINYILCILFHDINQTWIPLYLWTIYQMSTPRTITDRQEPTIMGTVSSSGSKSEVVGVYVVVVILSESPSSYSTRTVWLRIRYGIWEYLVLQ